MGLAAGPTGVDTGVEAAATDQGAAVATRRPPLIVGLKIESVSRTECLSWRAGPARLIQNPKPRKNAWVLKSTSGTGPKFEGNI